MSLNPFVERVANVLANYSEECKQAPDRHRAMANRLEEARLLTRPVETVHAPYPVKVRRAGLMVELDASALVRALLLELASQFRENPEDVGEELLELAALSDSVNAQHTLDGRGPAAGELDEKVDKLLDELGGAQQHLTSQNAWDLGHLLIERAGPRLPHQQHRDAA